MQFRGFEIIGIELAQVYYQNIASVLSLFNMHLFDRRHYRVIIPIILSMSYGDKRLKDRDV
jgi:hypothetical protein